MSREFTPLKRNCPVCNGARKDCRQSARTNFIHCRDDLANPPDYTFLGTDVWGFAIWGKIAELEAAAAEEREEWRRQREQQRKLRRQEEALARSQLLNEAERDIQIRDIFSQLSLNRTHRADLLRRNLTESQIDRGMFRSVERWQKLERTVSHRLAGVNITGRGLTNPSTGYLCPIWNENQKIIGWQLRLDNPDDGGKYRWPTSASKKRPNGPTAHLQNGELPLTYCQPEEIASLDIGLAEGILKPWIASQKRKQIILGASGGNFASSPETFKRYLDAASKQLGGTKNCILYADGGATANANVIRQYKATILLAKQFGYQVRIGWWGQTSKDDPDIDELPIQTQIETIDLDRFLKLTSVQERSRLQPGEISQEEWLTRKAFHTFLDLYKEVVGRFLPQQKAEPEVEQSKAIVPYKGVTTLVLDNPDHLPPYDRWLEMNKPKIQFAGSQDRLAIYIAARAKGYPALVDRSNVGMGKSWQSGELQRRHFGLEERDNKGQDVGGRIVYIAADYKNPTTLTVEKNFVELTHRHNGESLDPARLTPMGKPYRIRTPQGKQPDLPSNCPETDTFLVANIEKDAMIFGGEDSPICSRCPLLNSCEFLETRKTQLKAKYNLRAHIDSLGSFTEKDIAILDEPGTLLQPTKSNEISLKDIESLGFRLQQKDPQAYNLIGAFLSMVWQKLSQLAHIPNWGYNMVETLGILAGEADERTIEIWKRYRRREEAFEHPVVAALRTKLEQTYPNCDPWETPGIAELEAQITKAISHNWDEILSGCQTPESKQQAIRDKAILNWLSPLLKAITGENKFINIRINQNKRLELTRPSRRHQRTLQSFGFAIMLDATASISDLSRKTGFKHILEIEQKMADNACSNLKLRVIKGLGSNPKGTTADTTWKRYYAALQALIENQPELTKKQRTIITFKDDVERFKELEAQVGYWHRDSRGNNRFTEVRQMIIHGLPKPNLADKAAEWQALTGDVVDSLAQGKTRYGAWYWSEVLAELIQCCGRPRAHLRPNEQIEISVMAGDALTDRDISILRQKFPGCAIEIIDAYDLAPAAASKGEQKARGLLEIACQMVRETGDASRQEIAKILVIHPSRVSQLAKEATGKTFRELVDALVLLYKAIKEKLTLKELGLDEGELNLAEVIFPLFAIDLENPDYAKEAADILASSMLKPTDLHWLRRVLAATPPWALCKMLGGLMKVALTYLTDSSPPTPQVQEGSG